MKNVLPKILSFFYNTGEREKERLYITKSSENGKMPGLDKDEKAKSVLGCVARISLGLTERKPLFFNEEAPALTSRPQERPEQPEVSTPAVRAAFLTALSGATAHRLYVRRYLLKFLMSLLSLFLKSNFSYNMRKAYS